MYTVVLLMLVALLLLGSELTSIRLYFLIANFFLCYSSVHDISVGTKVGYFSFYIIFFPSRTCVFVKKSRRE